MAKIYLIRHAESVANTQGIYQGQTYDTSLSNLGKKQAQVLGKRFARKKFNAVFTSPLLRAQETAAVLGGPKIITPDLMETNHGKWEGLSKIEIQRRWPNMVRLWQTQPSIVKFPGGEKFTETAVRARNWFAHLTKQPGEFAVVTHINIIQAILTDVLNLSLDHIWQYPAPPTAVTLIETYSPIKIVFLNDISHLVGLESNLSAQAL